MPCQTLTGRDLGKQLADILETGNIVSITIRAHVKEAALVTIERYAKRDEQDAIATVIERYRLVPAEDVAWDVD